MVVLPIVTRELRVAARRKSTYRFRLAVAVGALLVGGWIMLIEELRSPQRLGMAMFVALSVVAFIESFLSGIVTTSDCVSEEKREGTLGLLFLTDLKGYDIVFGKLAATSLNAFYGLVAIFPIMAIALLAGGVTGAEFGRVMMVAVNTMFFSLSLGVFASTLCRDERVAGALTFFGLLFFSALLPVIGGVLSHWKQGSLWSGFLALSPGYSAVMAFDANFRNATAGKFNLFYPSIICVHLCAWVFLALASAIVPGSWRDKTPTQSRFKLDEVWQSLRHGSSGGRIAYRRRALDLNPIFWLTSRDRSSPWTVWGLLGVCALVWLWGALEFEHDFFDEPVYVLTGISLHCLLKLWVAGEACKRFSQDRRNGALELILSTPISIRKVLRGQLLSLWGQFAGPTAFILALDFLFLLAKRHTDDWVTLWVIGMVSFACDLIALAWVGMWMGLCSRRANRAAGAAVSRIMVLPWVVWGVLMTLLLFGSTTGFSVAKHSIYFWLFISLAANIGFGWWARARLLNDFREIATKRYDHHRGFFARATRAAAPVQAQA